MTDYATLDDAIMNRPRSYFLPPRDAQGNVIFPTPKVMVTPRVLFDAMPDADLARLDAEVKRERAKRMAPISQAFSNFLLGVSQAMAARSVLRWSKGLKPHAVAPNPPGRPSLAGGTPASGEMWHADEGAVMERLMARGMAVAGLFGVSGSGAPRFNPMVQTALQYHDAMLQEGLYQPPATASVFDAVNHPWPENARRLSAALVPEDARARS